MRQSEYKIRYCRPLLAILVLLTVLMMGFPAQPVFAAKGSLTIDPLYGSPGTDIDIEGSGFTADSTYKIVRGSTLILTGDVDSDGCFSTSYTIPDLPSGDYKFSATTSASDTTGTAATFTLIPILKLGATSGKVGDIININGKGFKKSGNVDIYFDGTSVKTPVSDNTGSFSSAFTVPEATCGVHKVIAKDSQNYTEEYKFRVSASLSVDQLSPTADSQTTVSGRGFSGSSVITFYLDGDKIDSIASTDSIGSFSDVKVDIPSIRGGTHILKAMDNKEYSDSVKINVTQSIAINPEEGPVETLVTITGSGFSGGKKITVYYQGLEVNTSPADITSDAYGDFTADVKIPASVAGSYEITANDGNHFASVNYNLVTLTTLKPASGPVGSEVSVIGTGFDSGAPITIKYDGLNLAAAAADSSGTFKTTFIVPAGLAGQHKVIVTDGVNPKTYYFDTVAAALISNASGSGFQISGSVGSEISVSGDAFTPDQAIVITYDSIEITNITADVDGSFSTSFKVPGSKSGNHLITVSDGINTSSSTFIMESISPQTPIPISPAKDARVNNQESFTWSAVADTSGVEYCLQIARDPNFISVILQKNGLNSNSFQLSEAEALVKTSKNNPYYWRVKAIDKASNESPWSSSSTFSVGFIIPPQLIYVLCALGALVLFWGGFFVGKRWPELFNSLGIFKQIPELATGLIQRLPFKKADSDDA